MTVVMMCYVQIKEKKIQVTVLVSRYLNQLFPCVSSLFSKLSLLAYKPEGAIDLLIKTMNKRVSQTVIAH